jgi:mannose-1-phosphate guanylyltransferase/mannose-6-phosphate isomerase
MTQSPVIVPVIMSGGAGTRLWPLSTRSKPKQLHALAGKLTLLQQTVLRCPQTRGFAAPMLVCAKQHAEEVLAQCEAVNTSPSQIITEPCPRNTAPCAVTAALAVREKYGENAQVLLLAADHFMADNEAFEQAVKAGAKTVAVGHILTFGAQPNFPATGYGYIRRGAALEGSAFAVAAFIEKPDAERAQTYLQSGDYVWNAGIFLFRARVMLEEMQRHRPDILNAALQAWEAATSAGAFRHLDEAAFAQCPAESVDYAVMEKTGQAAVVPLDAGWSDVGAWPAIHDMAKKDDNENAVHGLAVTHNTRNCLLYAEENGPMIATLGVENLVVVSTAKAVLVVPMDQTDNIKALIEKLGEGDR